MNDPMTLQEAIVYFSNPDNCVAYLVERRWPNGVVCPKRGSLPDLWAHRRVLRRCAAGVAVQDPSSEMPVFREGWHHHGRLSNRPGQVAHGDVDAGKLQERGEQLGDSQ